MVLRDWVVAWRGGGAVLPVSCALLVGEGCVECGVTVRDGAAWNVRHGVMASHAAWNVVS